MDRNFIGVGSVQPVLGIREVERTYLGHSILERTIGMTGTRMVDLYIPEDRLAHPRLRVRRQGDTYEITKKIRVTENGASHNLEYTIPLEMSEFDAFRNVSGRAVVKDRYDLSLGGHPAQVDVFREKLEGLILVDFEFESVAAALNFEAPDVCGAEVTHDDAFAGGLLAGRSFAELAEDLARYK